MFPEKKEEEMDMAVAIRIEGQRVIAVLRGEIDHHGARSMRAEIDEAIQAYQPSILILDFAEVTFMDSSGIGLIMGRHKLMGEIGGSVIVQNPPLHIKRVMKISGMERIVQIQMEKMERREEF